jgi:hypothetical protein
MRSNRRRWRVGRSSPEGSELVSCSFLELTPQANFRMPYGRFHWPYHKYESALRLLKYPDAIAEFVCKIFRNGRPRAVSDQESHERMPDPVLLPFFCERMPDPVLLP